MNRNEKLDKLSILYGSEHLNKRQYSILSGFAADEDSDVRLQVIFALKNCVSSESSEMLFLLATDNDYTVRFEAVSALESYKNEKTLKFLEALIKSEKNDVVYCAATILWTDISVLLNITDKNRMEKVLNKADNGDYRTLGLYYARYCFGDESTLEKITEYLLSENQALSCTALSLVEKIKTEKNKSKIQGVINTAVKEETSVAFKMKAEKILKA